MRTWILFVSVAALAQPPRPKTLPEALAGSFRAVHQNLVETLEKVPEGYLDFRPTAEVMSFREQARHMIDEEFGICGAAGKKTAGGSRAELLAGAKESGAYCESALLKLAKAQPGMAVHVIDHDWLHYGNLVTTMRLKGMTPPETAREQTAAAPAKAEMVQYYMGFLKRGPAWTPQSTPETQKIQEGHMAHIRKSAEAGKLVLAGPFGDNGDIRGILIYKTANLEEARAIANEDPAVKAGRLVLEIHPWWVEKGSLP